MSVLFALLRWIRQCLICEYRFHSLRFCGNIRNLFKYTQYTKAILQNHWNSCGIRESAPLDKWYRYLIVPETIDLLVDDYLDEQQFAGINMNVVNKLLFMLAEISQSKKLKMWHAWTLLSYYRFSYLLSFKGICSDCWEIWLCY